MTSTLTAIICKISIDVTTSATAATDPEYLYLSGTRYLMLTGYTDICSRKNNNFTLNF